MLSGVLPSTMSGLVSLQYVRSLGPGEAGRWRSNFFGVPCLCHLRALMPLAFQWVESEEGGLVGAGTVLHCRYLTLQSGSLSGVPSVLSTMTSLVYVNRNVVARLCGS